MFHLWRLIQGLIPHLTTDAERDEAYLADSVDRYDLEWRMQQIDRRHHQAAIGGHWTVGAS